MKLTLAEQNSIFTSAQTEGIELADALDKFGYCIDDLIYENSNIKNWAGTRPRQLTDLEAYKHDVPFVSFFTGCGGMDIGFETAGFCHAGAFEISELFCKTLRKNRSHWNVFGPPRYDGDVSNVEEVVNILEHEIPRDFEGVFLGGPPCQPFSIAASQRFTKSGTSYKRIGFDNETNGGLVFDYVRIIKHFRPKCFVIENVPGLRDLDGGKQLAAVIQSLEQSGYSIAQPKVINAADFGVPQYRERMFVVGSRTNKQFVFPSPCHEHIGCGSVLSREKKAAKNDEPRNHKLSSIIRYAKLKYGQRDQLGRVDRLDPSIPSKTVIAGGNNGGGRSHLHPEIPRTLTVRECARLQTFPDDYEFVGTIGRQFTQVGNAVPPMLAAQIANSIAETVFGIS